MSKQEILSSIASDVAVLKRAMLLHTPDSSVPSVTPSQWFALRVIEDEAHTVKGVAQALRISSSAATQLVDGLEKSGYVIRKKGETDKREVQLSLSPQCKKVMTRMKEDRMKRFSELFSVLSTDEIQDFAAIVKKVAANVAQSIQ